MTGTAHTGAPDLSVPRLLAVFSHHTALLLELTPPKKPLPVCNGQLQGQGGMLSLV